ncbi:MAG TPA: methylmalonyl-CoA epimerase [Candidatus Limnocylindrales bacterium]|nr:methylmalonyl-CoA epimerase [Candidatus Limnocylindrales bacterium]
MPGRARRSQGLDPGVAADLRARLAPEGGGGLIETRTVLDVTSLTSMANEHGARFVLLDGPTSKRAMLAAISTSGLTSSPIGRDWGSLADVLSHPAPIAAGPVLIVWLDPGGLDTADAGTFRSIVRNAAARRIAGGGGPLVVVAGPSREEAKPMPTVPPRIRKLGKIHHVALVVRSIDASVGLWRDMLGLELETVMDIPSDQVRIAFLGVGESKVELVEATDDTTGVARFLAAKGEGFHHVCFEVGNLSEALIRLELDGLELIDTVPRRGAEGPVAFIHPRSCHGVLVELIEAPGGPAWKSLGYATPGG